MNTSGPLAVAAYPIDGDLFMWEVRDVSQGMKLLRQGTVHADSPGQLDDRVRGAVRAYAETLPR